MEYLYNRDSIKLYLDKIDGTNTYILKFVETNIDWPMTIIEDPKTGDILSLDPPGGPNIFVGLFMPNYGTVKSITHKKDVGFIIEFGD